MESLKISDLTFNYNTKNIFENYNLELELGKIYALVAPSGIGKSTFAHLIAGHLKPKSGEIYLGLKKIEKPTRDIFIVHQEDDLFPWLTVKQQLKFVSAENEKIEKLLKIFKLQESKDLFPIELSGGMKKRLALARAELVGARVLILDETLSSLNEDLLTDILNEMIPRWRKQKLTVIFITHHFDDIKDYIDEAIRL
jgi:NitT/TauT family transport system ATP-binding protein